ncbi:MAG: hypothetical protein EHM42_00455 [Planctomycetaceae bacterium]|nr:MAG: hypothetical protein EHM42_00455 [Planctomycetaceae bacterium]
MTWHCVQSMSDGLAFGNSSQPASTKLVDSEPVGFRSQRTLQRPCIPRSCFVMTPTLQTIGLLTLSNVFMTFAW